MTPSATRPIDPSRKTCGTGSTTPRRSSLPHVADGHGLLVSNGLVRSMKRISRHLLAVLTAAGLLGACSAEAGLGAPIDTLVELEASWQCDVTRFSFESAEKIEEKLGQARTRFGVAETDHRLFVDMVEADVALRDLVADRHDELCPVGG